MSFFGLFKIIYLTKYNNTPKVIPIVEPLPNIDNRIAAAQMDVHSPPPSDPAYEIIVSDYVTITIILSTIILCNIE